MCRTSHFISDTICTHAYTWDTAAPHFFPKAKSLTVNELLQITSSAGLSYFTKAVTKTRGNDEDRASRHQQSHPHLPSHTAHLPSHTPTFPVTQHTFPVTQHTFPLTPPPSQSHSTPSKSHSTPSQSHSTLSQSHSTPSQSHPHLPSHTAHLPSHTAHPSPTLRPRVRTATNAELIKEAPFECRI
jgi:hypothetical protein